MQTSNIVAGSNVYLTRTDEPRLDPDFVAQILDYDLLKAIIGMRELDSRAPHLSQEQVTIVQRGIRCTFAKNDPCIGLVKGKGTQVKCINKDCPGIYDRSSFHGKTPWKGCNPEITEEYIKEWTPNIEDMRRYGNPSKLSKYYIVDLISDEEMNRYTVDPGNYGIDHPTPPAPVYMKPELETEKYRIDPKTGRKMVIIGYSKLKYPDEDGLGDPIWGFVDEVKTENQTRIIRKEKKIEKKNDIQSAKRPAVSIAKIPEKKGNPDYAHKAEYEKAVVTHIVEEIKLTNFSMDNISPNDTVILFDNPAEMAFVSNTLLVDGIDHGYSNDSSVTLALIDNYRNYISKNLVFISNAVLRRGCQENNVEAWKVLAGKNDIQQLMISDRDYYEFLYAGGKRWTCRNMYGVTHVCVTKNDIEIENLNDGLYPVLIVNDNDSYMVLQKNGNPLGHLRMSFVNMIEKLKEIDEITATPQVIKGISLKVTGGNVEVLGMGHLKFVEY